MTKDEAEPAIRHLCSLWADEKGIVLTNPGQPSFSEFLTWLYSKGYGHYLTFRSRTGPREDAERWFDQEFRQTWRN